MQNYGQNPGTYYYVNDHLGTPQQLITATGLVVWQAAYLPYGEAQVRINLVENNLRFPGQYFDAESGLHYNWNRYYDAQTGRYISADPIGLYGGMNVYAYVNGNPVNYIDIYGLDVFYCEAKLDKWRHVWLCVDEKCGGLSPNTSDPSAFFGPGIITESFYIEDKCKNIDIDGYPNCNQAIYEDCIKRNVYDKIGTPHNYGWALSNCISFGRGNVLRCQEEACSSK